MMKTFINKTFRNSTAKQADKESALNYHIQDTETTHQQQATDQAKMKSSPARNSSNLGKLWIGIFITSICAFTSLIYAVIQNEVVFFEDVAWDNEDSVALPRAYTIAFMTASLSLLTSSYGFWRQYVPSHLKSIFDELSVSLLTANGAMCLCCFIMYMSFDVSWIPLK